jgi:hypothetical protein
MRYSRVEREKRTLICTLRVVSVRATCGVVSEKTGATEAASRTSVLSMLGTVWYGFVVKWMLIYLVVIRLLMHLDSPSFIDSRRILCHWSSTSNHTDRTPITNMKSSYVTTDRIRYESSQGGGLGGLCFADGVEVVSYKLRRRNTLIEPQALVHGSKRLVS